jgi:hypothetical protein
MYEYADRETSWHAELSTYMKNGCYIDLALHAPQTIEALERFYEHAFVALDGRDYDTDEYLCDICHERASTIKQVRRAICAECAALATDPTVEPKEQK